MAAQFLKDREAHARHKQGRCRGCLGERQAQVTDFLLLGLCDATFFTLCMGENYHDLAVSLWMSHCPQYDRRAQLTSSAKKSLIRSFLS
jgi:hypothetical protein